VNTTSRWPAITAIAYVLLLVGSVVVGGSAPDPKDAPIHQVATFYADNEASVTAGAFIALLAGTVLMFFAAQLRRALEVADRGGILPRIAFAGAIMLALAFALDGTISLALAGYADTLDGSGLRALSALYFSDYVPLNLGAQVLLLGAGLSIVRSGALPRAYGWVAVVLGVIAGTPVGFFAFVAGGLWIVAVGIQLSRGAGASATVRGASPVAAH
jgi:hypothetical protein